MSTTVLRRVVIMQAEISILTRSEASKGFILLQFVIFCLHYLYHTNRRMMYDYEFDQTNTKHFEIVVRNLLKLNQFQVPGTISISMLQLGKYARIDIFNFYMAGSQALVKGNPGATYSTINYKKYIRLSIFLVRYILLSLKIF